MAERAKIPLDFPGTLRRLNYLIERLQVAKYLEIGLGNGGTFDNVNAPEKVGVDPQPWNPAVRDLEGVHLLTSDEYFSRHRTASDKFDLILLDGVHTAEQTYRDFVNSLCHAHPTTVWLIDDVMPSDVFSAIPNHAEAIRLRRAAIGGTDSTWHGDVYKVIWMIKTFHGNMTLRTFRHGQPQALVYSSGAEKAATSALTLGEISNLSYIDTLARRAEYNLGDETEILVRDRDKKA